MILELTDYGSGYFYTSLRTEQLGLVMGIFITFKQ